MSGVKTIGGFEGELEEVRCFVCKGASPSVLVARNSDGIGFWRCAGCQLMYASPRFTEHSLLDIYENPAFFAPSFRKDWTYQDWRDSDSRAYTHARIKIQFVRRFLRKGERLLDVGCGHGLTLAEAKECGLDPEGLDPSKMLTSFARQQFGVVAHSCFIDDFNSPIPYDGILVWDVLEHVPDPTAVLNHCNRLLKPGGFLFLQVPNHRGISNRLKVLLNRIGLREDFGHFGFPWHIYSFSPETIRIILEESAFDLLLLESWSGSMKNDRDTAFYRPFNQLIRGRCWGDYLSAVGRKESWESLSDVQH